MTIGKMLVFTIRLPNSDLATCRNSVRNAGLFLADYMIYQGREMSKAQFQEYIELAQTIIELADNLGMDDLGRLERSIDVRDIRLVNDRYLRTSNC